MQGIYFIDAETVPTQREFPEGTPIGDFFKKRFKHEHTQVMNEFITNHDLRIEKEWIRDWELKAWQTAWDKNAALSSEFCQIVSISIGSLTPTKGNPQPLFYVKTFTGRDEAVLLKELANALNNAQPTQLGGHNILEFDGPLLMRLYLKHGLKMPLILDTMLKKTWEIPFMDTMKMYSGSAWNYKISLAQLAYILGIPSPKDKMSGSNVSGLYYSDGLTADADEAEAEMENGLRLIGEYNAGDVVCTARCFAKMRGHKEIKDVDIFHIKPTPLNEGSNV
jgi:hypothetical protein